jgi:hypothetical protein
MAEEDDGIPGTMNSVPSVGKADGRLEEGDDGEGGRP